MHEDFPYPLFEEIPILKVKSPAFPLTQAGEGRGGGQGIPCSEGNCSVLVIYKRSLVGTINVREIFPALFW